MPERNDPVDTPYKSFGKTVRVEPGPALKTAKATAELLSDEVTAAHYAVGARDAKGEVIELGQPMAYLDWKGERVFYLYQLRDDDSAAEGQRWFEVDTFATEEAAHAAAQKLAG